jgi:hypothetical protein
MKYLYNYKNLAATLIAHVPDVIVAVNVNVPPDIETENAIPLVEVPRSAVA